MPGCFDPFEMSVRAVLGQQITVKAARTLAMRLATVFGEKITTPFAGLAFTFPQPDKICALEGRDRKSSGTAWHNRRQGPLDSSPGESFEGWFHNALLPGGPGPRIGKTPQTSRVWPLDSSIYCDASPRLARCLPSYRLRSKKGAFRNGGRGNIGFVASMETVAFICNHYFVEFTWKKI